MREALDDFPGEGGGVDVESLADFLTDLSAEASAKEDETVAFGVFPYFRSDDDTLGGGKAFEGVAKFVGPTGSCLSWFLFSRRSLVVGPGGVGLFCLVLQEGEQELVGAELLTLRSVESFEQSSDEVFLKLKFPSKFGDFSGQFLDLLVFGVDGYPKQIPGQLGAFIPRSFKTIAQVDAVSEHGQGGGFEDEFFPSFFDVLGPAEGAFFEAFED